MDKVLQKTGGPHSPVGVGGCPSKPFYHRGLIKVEIKTSRLEGSFTAFTGSIGSVGLLIKGLVMLPFCTAFGVLGENCSRYVRGISFFLFWAGR